MERSVQTGRLLKIHSEHINKFIESNRSQKYLALIFSLIQTKTERSNICVYTCKLTLYSVVTTEYSAPF